MGHHMTRILKERGHLGSAEGAGDARGILLAAEQRTHRGGLRQHPVHGAEGRLHGDQHGRAQDTVNAINARRAAKQGTAKADYLKLDDMGILGVTHMMMLDKKNLEIADVIYDWLDKNVRVGRQERR